MPACGSDPPPSPGQSQFLTTPALAKPLDLASLSLDDAASYEENATTAPRDSDARLMEKLQAQAAAHQAGQGLQDEQAIISNEKLTKAEKKDMLQKALNMAASNGDVVKLRKLLSPALRPLVDVNALDEDGTPPLIYASCFVSLPARPSFAQFSLPPLAYTTFSFSLSSPTRATRLLSRPSSRLVPMSTSKTAISGAPSCGP